MTFCLGSKGAEELGVGAGTYVVKGYERLRKTKRTLLPLGARPVVLRTAGLRSGPKKMVVEGEEKLSTQLPSWVRLSQVATVLGEQVRWVWPEDALALARRGLAFNLPAILGGQREANLSPLLFYLYPEGNWIEAAADTPDFVIGCTPSGKPLRERFLVAETTLSPAGKLAALAFDATCRRVTAMDFPLALLVLTATNQYVPPPRSPAAMLATPQEWWQRGLPEALAELPMVWGAPVLPGARQNSARGG